MSSSSRSPPSGFLFTSTNCAEEEEGIPGMAGTSRRVKPEEEDGMVVLKSDMLMLWAQAWWYVLLVLVLLAERSSFREEMKNKKGTVVQQRCE